MRPRAFLFDHDQGDYVAGFGGIAAVGESIVRFLKAAFADFPGGTVLIEQVTTRTFADSGTGGAGGTGGFNTAGNSLTLLLYRVDIDTSQVNPTVWTHPPPPGQPQKVYALPLDLRYLITAWAQQPEMQQLILGRALSAIASKNSFGPSDLLDTVGGVGSIWGPDESFQFVPDEMGTEDLYQIWESLGGRFELSVPFKARVIRLEAEAVDTTGVVIERDLGFGKAVEDVAS